MPGSTDADRSIVADNADRLAEILPDAVDALLRYIATTGSGGRIDERMWTRLRAVVIAHWRRLFTHGTDADYINDVTRIGIVHREHGIVTKDYMMSYGCFTSQFVERLGRDPSIEPEARAALIAALLKLIFFDMAMAVGSYDAALLD